MSWRPLEAITVEKGEAKGSLADRLKNRSEKGVLHPSLSEWAREVRLIGNKSAHFESINEALQSSNRFRTPTIGGTLICDILMRSNALLPQIILFTTVKFATLGGWLDEDKHICC